MLYKGEFPRNNLGVSSFRLYDRIFHSLLTEHLARDSFFLQMMFFGELPFEQGFPVECRPEVYARARQALSDCAVEVVEGDVLGCAASLPRSDFVSLSDVPSFLPDRVVEDLLQRLKPSLEPNALTVVRGHMRVVHPRMDGFLDISERCRDVLRRELTQLWHVHVYLHQA